MPRFSERYANDRTARVIVIRRESTRWKYDNGGLDIARRRRLNYSRFPMAPLTVGSSAEGKGVIARRFFDAYLVSVALTVAPNDKFRELVHKSRNTERCYAL